jgi:hypothetical protein
MNLGVTAVVFARPSNTVARKLAPGLIRYATDVTTSAATSEAAITAHAIALAFTTLAESIAAQA